MITLLTSGGFGLGILSDDGSLMGISDEGYVEMRDGQVYSIYARNTNKISVKCKVTVSIDGKNIGTWVIQPYQEFILSTPTSGGGQFTFVDANSSSYISSGGARVSKSDQGVVSVLFEPELVITPLEVVGSQYNANTLGVPKDVMRGGGITGLSGKSDQHFVRTSDFQTDRGASLEIALRLVGIPASSVRSIPAPPPL